MKKSILFALKAWPILTIATLLVSFLTQAICSLCGFDIPEQMQTQEVRNLLLNTPHNLEQLISYVINVTAIIMQVSIFAPLLEETIFRLPTRLAWNRTWLWVPVALFFAAFFCFAHYPDYLLLFKEHILKLRPLDTAFIGLFIFGLGQCYIYRKSRSLFCCMLVHGLFNFTSLVLLCILPQSV